MRTVPLPHLRTLLRRGEAPEGGHESALVRAGAREQGSPVRNYAEGRPGAALRGLTTPSQGAGSCGAWKGPGGAGRRRRGTGDKEERPLADPTPKADPEPPSAAGCWSPDPWGASTLVTGWLRLELAGACVLVLGVCGCGGGSGHKS